MVDAYLSEEHSGHWSEIAALAKVNDKDSYSKLKGYAQEGCRLSPNNFGHIRCAVAPDAPPKEGIATTSTANEVYVNLVVPERLDVTDSDARKSRSACLP
jgi:hypothetical protein